jgi:bacillithiol biosynthesis cysteine-adding enzyme BshC
MLIGACLNSKLNIRNPKSNKMDAACLDYKETGYFSHTLTDYLDDLPALRPFYGNRPDLNGFAELIKGKKVVADRKILVNVLRKQYGPAYADHNLVLENISLLAAENTYTITTGHQLNIFGGPLYFLYKIATAIKLSRQLKQAFPDKNFVPIYWMASEDHDFAEINYTNIGGKKVHWWHESSGATGRINPDTMRQALNQYKGALGIERHAGELAEIVESAYTKFDKLADATRYFVNALFGRYGLVIIDADDHQFKQEFAPIMERDIIEQNSFKNIGSTNEKLQQLGVHIQVNPREINFFYLLDGLRERVVFEQGRYKVLDSRISFSEAELKEEIKNHPERFSPNVVMRPLYQECILPNLAYIGGGAELVYWLELKSNFDYYGIDFPILVLRNSALLIVKELASKISKMELDFANLFKSADAIKKNWIKKHSANNLSLANELQELSAVFDKIKQQAGKIDGTLVPSSEAILARLKRAISNLEKKLISAEKRNYGTRLEQIDHIKMDLFPTDGLQERTENFGLFYVKWGKSFIDELIHNFEPLDFKFTVLTE